MVVSSCFENDGMKPKKSKKTKTKQKSGLARSKSYRDCTSVDERYDKLIHFRCVLQ